MNGTRGSGQADVGPVAGAARRHRAAGRAPFARLGPPPGGPLAGRIFFIAQCALAAGVAWALARYVLGHPQPFFAPVAAMVCLGFSFGQRLRRVAEVMVGVAVGVGGRRPVRPVLRHRRTADRLRGRARDERRRTPRRRHPDDHAGRCPGRDRHHPAAESGRRVQPLARCRARRVVALAAATIAPAAAIRRPRQQASEVLNELSEILIETADGLRDSDEKAVTDALRRARASESMLDELRSAADEGVAVVRMSPFRRRHRVRVQQIADLVVPLDRAIRNIRVLVRRCAVSVWRDEQMPAEYPMLLDRLADGTRLIARVAVRTRRRRGRAPRAGRARPPYGGDAAAHRIVRRRGPRSDPLDRRRPARTDRYVVRRSPRPGPAPPRRTG